VSRSTMAIFHMGPSGNGRASQSRALSFSV
jgi:hypothetical protein